MLARAFQDDPAWVWVIPTPKRRARAAAVALPRRLRGDGRRGVGDARAGARAAARWLPPGPPGDARRADAARARRDAAARSASATGPLPRLRPRGRGAARRGRCPGRTGTSPGSASTRRRSGRASAPRCCSPGSQAPRATACPRVLLTNSEVEPRRSTRATASRSCGRARRPRTARTPGLMVKWP